MTPRILTLAFVTFVGVSAYAQTAFEPVARTIRAQPLHLSSESELVSLSPADKDSPRERYTIERKFAADGSFVVDWQTERFKSHQVFRSDGTLLAARQSDALRDQSLEQTSDPGRTSLRTVITVAGQVKSDKRVELRPGMALRDELQNLAAQGWMQGIRDGLKFQSLSPDGGMVGDFLIQYRKTADPTALSDKYAYPAEFKTALSNHGPFVVADMSLLGIAAFFFPHHFYLVYTQGAQGLEFFAYFGEDPKKPVFQFVTSEGQVGVAGSRVP